MDRMISDMPTLTKPNPKIVIPLLRRIVEQHESFLGVVRPVLKAHDMTKYDAEQILRIVDDLAECQCDRDRLIALNIAPSQRKPFERFLRKYQLVLPE